MQRLSSFVLAIIVLSLAVGGGRIAYVQWQAANASPAESDKPAMPVVEGSIPARLTLQARKNLGLTSKAVQLGTYWRTIDLPGVITDRPGISDRGVVSPVTGIVTKIHAYPGDTVAPDSPLFSVRIVSETIQAAQLELFKASKEKEISQRRRERLEKAATAGGIPQSRVIETENEIELADVSVQAYRQELKARGFPPERVDSAAQGEFVTEITVKAPSESNALSPNILASASEDAPRTIPFAFELHELKVQLGQQIEAGAVLCFLADHRSLMIEGHGFKDDMPLIQRAAKERLPIEVEFETQGGDWPTISTSFLIHHVANTIDLETRTFAFFLSLENQGQAYQSESGTRLLWRFRPGDRVRLKVAVEKMDNVFTVPMAAVVREGAEAYVFRQNGDLFDRLPVHIVAEGRNEIVLANDGSMKPGFAIAQSGAASINRILKAQASSGMPAGLHVHADGSVHGAH